MVIAQGLNLFLISLFSVYIGGVPVFTILGAFSFVLVGFLYGNPRVGLCLPDLIFFLLLFFISVLGAIFGAGFDSVRFFVYFSFIVLLVFLPRLISRKDIPSILTVFLCLHGFFFYFQFVSYYVFGCYFNILSVFGLESRNLGGTWQLPWGVDLMRASGLFSEPGTYACFIAPMLALYSGLLNSGFNKAVYYITLFSLAFSLSTFGIVFFIFISFFMLSGVVFKFVALCLGVGFSVPYLYWRFYERASLGLETGLGFRSEYISTALSNFYSLEGFLFGFGGLGVNEFAYTVAGADNDSGLIFYILYNFGGIAFFACLLLLIYALFFYRYWSFVGILILFASKISFYAYALPFYMVFLLHYSNRKGSV
ncbi:TPA: hypothetical protein ACMDR5_002839 [Vibrio cholerae]